MSFNVSITPEWFIQTIRKSLPSSSSRINGNIEVTLYPSWYKQIAVEWKVPPEFGQCLFNVYFSQTEDGPFERINQVPISGTFLLDTSTREYSKFDEGWYLVYAVS